MTFYLYSSKLKELMNKLWLMYCFAKNNNNNNNVLIGNFYCIFLFSSTTKVVFPNLKLQQKYNELVSFKNV